MEKTIAIANKQREIFDSFYERDIGIAAMLSEYEAQPRPRKVSTHAYAYAMRYHYQEISYLRQTVRSGGTLMVISIAW